MPLSPPLVLTLLSVLLVSGCGTERGQYGVTGQDDYGGQYEPKPQVSESLFASDTNVIGNEVLERILDGEITLKDKAKVAVLPMGRWNADETGTAGGNIDLLRNLLTDKRIVGVTRIPPLLLPQDKRSIPYIREACARLQCDLVLVYRVDCRITYESNIFTKDTARSHASVEALVIDVRTGVVPWTDLVDHEIEIEETKKDDLHVCERARDASVSKGIAKIGSDFNAYLAALR